VGEEVGQCERKEPIPLMEIGWARIDLAIMFIGEIAWKKKYKVIIYKGEPNL